MDGARVHSCRSESHLLYGVKVAWGRFNGFGLAVMGRIFHDPKITGSLVHRDAVVRHCIKINVLMCDG